MYELAKITGYRIGQEGTELKIFIPGKNLQEPIESKNMHKCGVWFDDGRHISAEQRKKAYATIKDISVHTGYLPEELKEWLKYLHVSNTGCEYFSLSNCTMDTARGFINTILEYAIENGIILTERGVLRTDDIGAYLYMCIKHKKCCICGKHGEIHHVDTIGMGNNRNKIDDSDKRKMCLCREHHTEAHTVGIDSFTDKYIVYGILI